MPGESVQDPGYLVAQLLLLKPPEHVQYKRATHLIYQPSFDALTERPTKARTNAWRPNQGMAVQRRNSNKELTTKCDVPFHHQRRSSPIHRVRWRTVRLPAMRADEGWLSSKELVSPGSEQLVKSTENLRKNGCIRHRINRKAACLVDYLDAGALCRDPPLPATSIRTRILMFLNHGLALIDVHLSFEGRTEIA